MVRAVVVSGPPGAGKSTLGAALAARLGAVLLDLDTLTNPVLDGVGSLIAPDSHWNDPMHRAMVRPARYDALRSVAADQVGVGLDVVLVAPFARELAGGPEWEALRNALLPAEPVVVWLDAASEVRADRVRRRAEPRDQDEWSAGPGQVPQVPHVRLDAGLPSAEHVDRVCVSMV